MSARQGAFLSSAAASALQARLSPRDAARDLGFFRITISAPPKAGPPRGRPQRVVGGEPRRHTCSTATTPATAFSAPASALVTA